MHIIAAGWKVSQNKMIFRRSECKIYMTEKASQPKDQLPDDSILPHTLHACGLLLVAFACVVIAIWMPPGNSCFVPSEADEIGVSGGCDWLPNEKTKYYSIEGSLFNTFHDLCQVIWVFLRLHIYFW